MKPLPPKLNTFLLVDKPEGWTSFDVCAKLRKILGVKRIGHTGTLDPFATGLLVVAVGKCTKLIPFLEKDRKTYRTQILLGKTSDTLDPESAVRTVEGIDRVSIPTEAQISALLKERFTGEIEQVPPQFSALKVNGQRAYDLARKGESVVLKPRQTCVHNVSLLGFNFPVLEVVLTVSAGFYVRSFARDVGQALYGGGFCQTLRRTGVGEIVLEGDWPVLCERDLLNGEWDLEAFAIAPHKLIKKIVQIEVSPTQIPDIQAGRAIYLSQVIPNGERVFMQCAGQTIGLGEIIQGSVQPRVVF